MKRIVCFHLFNDYSGSPKVLHGVVEGLLERGFRIDLITSRGGVLDTLSHPRLRIRHYNYRFSENPLLTMVRYSWVQLLTFMMALRYASSKDTVFYINTILPVGPALAGRLTGKRVVYHYHENAMVKSGFYRALCSAMQQLAHRIICVSGYQASFLKRQSGVEVIPNTLDKTFVSKLRPDSEAAFERKTVLMLSSLKAYKGTKEFISLASRHPRFRFILVINDTSDAIDRWLKDEAITPTDNITMHPRTSDVASFYNRASVVLNLSNPRLFIETFGLTALEAMACALPVIVPVAGGIAEMVTDGVNGYKIDCLDTEKLADTLTNLLSDKDLYLRLADNAYSFSKQFNREHTLDSLTSIILSND